MNVEEQTEYIIEIKKDYKNFKEGKTLKILIDNLEEVNSELWEELLKWCYILFINLNLS